MEWIVQESHRHGSYSGESRSIQLYPACLLWCLWLRKWHMIQTTYSPGSGSLGSQRGEEIANLQHASCTLFHWLHRQQTFGNPGHYVVSCRMGLRPPEAPKDAVCMNLAMTTLCLCSPCHLWIGLDIDVCALPINIGQCQDNLHLAWRNHLWRWICLR